MTRRLTAALYAVGAVLGAASMTATALTATGPTSTGLGADAAAPPEGGAQAAGQAAPAAPRELKAGARSYVIQNAKIVTLAGAPIERGTIVIEGGRIKAVGASVQAPAGAEVVDGSGLQVSPGFFDSVSQLGMTEIGAVAATNDTTEIGGYNPQLDAASAVHPPSEHIPVARADGITHAVMVPGLGSNGAVIGGQASALHLSGWTVEEMMIRKAVALSLNWPSLRAGGGGGGGGGGFGRRQRTFADIKEDHEKQTRALDDWIERARRYQQVVEKAPAQVERDLKLEALLPFVKGQLPLLVFADDARDIRNAVEFGQRQKLKIVIAGGADAYQVTELLAKHKVPVILGPVQALPSHEDEPYDIRNTTPGVLQKAGVPFALASFGSSDSRTIPFEIGNAVSYGLPQEEALKAVTLYPAQILGLGDQLGTLEAGKIANLVVTTGDPLEIRTQIRYVFVNGQPVSLDNKHRQSYDKWRGRPRPAGGPTSTR